MEKTTCEVCGKELKGYHMGLSGCKWMLFGFSTEYHSVDLCSKECLIKYVNEEIK